MKDIFLYLNMIFYVCSEVVYSHLLRLSMNVCVLCWFEGNGFDQMGVSIDNTTTANFFRLAEFTLKSREENK